MRNVQQTQPKAVSQALAATTDVIAAVAGASVYVYELVLVAATATTVQLFDGAVALTGVMSLAAGTPLVLPFLPEAHNHFSTAAGNAFRMALGGAVQVSGFVRYVQN